MYKGNLAWVQDPDKVLLKIQGGFSAEGVTAGTAVGASHSVWIAFERAEITSHTISLKLPGRSGHYVVVADHQFLNEDDWKSACNVTMSNCETTVM